MGLKLEKSYLSPRGIVETNMHVYILRTYVRSLLKILATIESAKASTACSSLCSLVLACARCARLAAALASLSARSFPYTPTCAGTCLNSTVNVCCCAKVDNTRLMTFHRSEFSSGLPFRVHPSASQSGSHTLIPSIQIRLSLKITR